MRHSNKYKGNSSSTILRCTEKDTIISFYRMGKNFNENILQSRSQVITLNKSTNKYNTKSDDNVNLEPDSLSK